MKTLLQVETEKGVSAEWYDNADIPKYVEAVEVHHSVNGLWCRVTLIPQVRVRKG